MNTIWQILKIDPTTDKRTIKKAYAGRAKVIHPEENPDEFQILYDAYQQALEYAGNGTRQAIISEKGTGGCNPDKGKSGVEKGGAEKDGSAASDKGSADAVDIDEADPDEADLQSFFLHRLVDNEKNLEEFQVRLADLCTSKLEIRKQQWKAYQNSKWEIGRKRWKEYQNSQEFHSIQWQPQVLELLTEKTKNELQEDEEFQDDLWSAYGFPEENDRRDREDVRQLYQALFPLAYERKEIVRRSLIKLEKKKARKKVLKRFLLLTASVCCLAAFIFLYRFVTAQQRYVSTSMTHKYENTRFSKPIKQKNPALSTKEIQTYVLHADSHPDLPITVYVKKEKVGSDRHPSYQMKDDYGIQLLKGWEDQYGLKWEYVEADDAVWSKGGAYTAFYSNGEEAAGLCTKILAMQNAHPELSFLHSVGICPANIRHPKIMIKGGYGSNFPEPQIYTLDQLADQETMKTDITKGYIDYMYNYEAWNLTPDLQEKYGEDYAKRGYQWERERPHRGELDYIEQVPSGLGYNLYLPIFPNTDVDADNLEFVTSYKIFIGNAYQLLKAEGAKLKVDEDGSGFEVDSRGKIFIYGNKIELDLNEILGLIGYKGPAAQVDTFEDTLKRHPDMK